MSLPLINVDIDNTIHAFEEGGRLLYKYSPLQNLKVEVEENIDLTNLRMSASTSNIDINTPVALDTEVSYDQSVNLIVNDYTNPLKIVNSRFYLTDSQNYKIADRRGNLDTNIYTEENFKTEAGLIKTVRSVISLDFLGIVDGGSMPVGSYHFYFKLADSDGNESDFISESGKVVCHIGSVNKPKSIRGGQLDEDSNKAIKFRLNNLDLSYDYINIYYTRSSGDNITKSFSTHKIVDKFKINGVSTELSITGYEDHTGIDATEINIRYASFDSAQTNENCQGITFVGNTVRNYEIYKTLEKLSLLITPSLSNDETIGNLNQNYQETYPKTGYEYYNVDNIYYKLGNWDEDIYRYGIVYILNDYTLSPVFNTRGIKELGNTTLFKAYSTNETINIGEDYNFETSYDNDNPENSKGIFKINNSVGVFNGSEEIKPIGIKFNFSESVISGNADIGSPGLKDFTKGFFLVRQKRIPTLLTQAVGIATSSKAYIPVLKDSAYYVGESFLKDHNGKPLLGRALFPIEDTEIQNNALLCPEATLRSFTFNNYFNSSEFTLARSKYESSNLFVGNNNIFSLGNLVYNGDKTETDTNLLLVEPGIELINNGDVKFSSRSGNELEAWTHADPINGDINDVMNSSVDEVELSNSVTKVRGEFNTYIGSSKDIEFGKYYNIFQKDYSFEERWKDYFRVRYNDSSPFMAVSDRISWDDLESESIVTYRGDCYINTYTHRMNWNFIDPELPTNTQIIDPWNWYKNYRVKTTDIRIAGDDIIVDDITGDLTGGSVLSSYKKVLPIFTYKSVDINVDIDTADVGDVSTYKITLPDGKKFDKYSEANGTFGTKYLNRPDVNGISLGHWATFKICSNVNLAMRDADFSRPAEEAVHGTKRKFHPFQEANIKSKLPESNILNSGISKSLSDKYYFEVPEVPFIKDTFTTRIHYSDILTDTAFKNGNRVFRGQNYQDYTLEHGELIKLIDWFGRLIAVMEHGILMIPVNERAMMKNQSGEDVYINTSNVLPKNPKVLSNTFGSVWTDSIIKTARWIYGIDTIAKKVWRTNGELFELISDLKIQKFLNDHIYMKSIERKKTPGLYSIKTHYNAFKSDILFVFKYGDKKWHLCWNELLEKWVTRNTWFPEFSENINNIFYTFANNNVHPNKGNVLYKHGFAGNEEELGNILPTKWYDLQEPFEYEFVVIGQQGIQKIFDNLKIISNLAKPSEFYYEIVGEGFDWVKQKKDIYGFEDDQEFIDYLNADSTRKKVPYIYYNSEFVEGYRDALKNKDLTIEENNKTKEKLVHSYQRGLDMKDNGRMRGNMHYVEDFWDVQIQPISFKYAYLDGEGELAFTNNSQMKIRDKYIKIRVKYDGTEYAIINALTTFFTISYA